MADKETVSEDILYGSIRQQAELDEPRSQDEQHAGLEVIRPGGLYQADRRERCESDTGQRNAVSCDLAGDQPGRRSARRVAVVMLTR